MCPGPTILLGRQESVVISFKKNVNFKVEEDVFTYNVHMFVFMPIK